MTVTDVHDANEQWQKSFGNHDVEGLLTWYAPDVRVLAPGVPAMQGHDQLRAFLTAMFDAGAKSCELHSLQVLESGDLVVDVGTYRMIIDPPGGDRVEDTGKYVDVLRKGPDGTLQIVVDTFNSDAAESG